ncbi:LCP family protein [Nocardiopsis halotolerans]|uniref:LCP family protein n=1 Tax=Nocardiopsis halotolerans TaxID=124252 RepID=UPI00034CDD67|nr:LCP family protein [Nocardiopsis halotolerans]
MSADENSSAASGADHTPDQSPEDDSAARSDPGDTGDDGAGEHTAVADTGADGSGGATEPVEGAENPGTDDVQENEEAEETARAPGAVESTEDAETDRADVGDAADEADPASTTVSGSAATAPTGDSASPKGSGGDGGADGNPGDGATASVLPAPRKQRRKRRILLWVAATLVLVLAAGVGTAYGYYRSLRSDMVQYDIDGLLGEEDRPDRLNDSVNILFMGTDGYEEGTTAYETAFEGKRSDSIMLAHVSPENRVSMISFPRDSLVTLPQCDPYGETEGTPGYFGMINAAMYHGGPPCVVRTIESLTDIRVDHFVHLSFMSFRDVVNAIGGVEMCIPVPMEDGRSGLDLDAGRQTLDGDEALSFVRARYEIGDGGDIGRIDRQQMFLAALADQATSNEVLTSPARLNDILRAVAEHSATDTALTFDRMLSIAVTLSGVELTDIEFHTVPWYQAPSDPNRVLWHEEQAGELFTAVREDRPLPVSMADEAPVPQETPGTSPSPVDEDVADASPEADAALPGVGRDATSDPCSDGLGYGTGEMTE